MATTLYFNAAQADWSRGQGDADLQGTTQNWSSKSLTTTRGVGAAGANLIAATSITGPVTGLTLLTGGVAYDFVSEPLDADITISGSITANLWAYETNMADNGGLGIIIQRLDSTGAVASTVMDNGEIGAEAPSGGGASAAVRNEATTPTSTDFLKGDRLRIRVYGNDAAGATMASGGAIGFSYSHTTAAGNGDSYVTFTENFGFLTTAPSGSQIFLTTTASDIDPNGASYDAKEAWTSRGSGVVTGSTSAVTGPTTPLLGRVSSSGNFLEWFTKQLAAFTLDGLIACNLRAYDFSNVNGAIRCEIAVCASDGTSPVIWGAANDGIKLIISTETAMTFSIAGDSTAITDGQRLRIRIYFDDAPGQAMVSGAGAFKFVYAGTSAAASGDTYLTLPQTVTEYSAGGDASVTPTTVAGTTAVDTPAISADMSLTLATVASTTTVSASTAAGNADTTPSTVTAQAFVDTPTVTGDANVTTTTVVAAVSIDLPGVVATSPNADTTPTTVIGTITIDAPAVVGNANAPPVEIAAIAAIPTPSVTGDSAVTTATVVAATSVDTPIVTGNADLTPTTVVGQAAVDTPTVEATTGGVDASVTPTTVAAQGSVDTPSVTADSNLTTTSVISTTTVSTPSTTANADLTLTTVAGSSTVPGVTVTADGNVTGTTVIGATTIPGVSVVAIQNPDVTPTTVAAQAVVETPSISTSGNADITTATVIAATTIDSPSVAADASITPTTIAGTTAVPTPALQGDSNTEPGTVTATAFVDTPNVVAGGNVNITPATVVGTTAVDTPAISAGTSITVGNVASATTVPGASVTGTAEVSPTTVAVVATIPTPTVTATQSPTITLSTVVAQASIDTPTVSASGNVSITLTTVAATTTTSGAAASINVDTLYVGDISGSTLVSPPVINADADVLLTTVVAQATVEITNTFIGAAGTPVEDPDADWTELEGELVMVGAEGRATMNGSEGEIQLLGTEGKAVWE